MIPLRCDIAQRRFAPATILLIIACFAVYVYQGRWDLLSKGFVPLDLTHSIFYPGSNTLSSIVAVAVAFFMHGSALHLISNMWYLWIFGSAVESRLGTASFIIVYTVCGAISMISQAVYSPLSAIPIVGASGAIAGLMGIHFILLPLSKILIWFPPIFFFRIPAFVFLLLWFYVQYANAGARGNTGVAWWAHIGGFVAGTCWGIYLRIHKRESQPRRKGERKKDSTQSSRNGW